MSLWEFLKDGGIGDWNGELQGFKVYFSGSKLVLSGRIMLSGRMSVGISRENVREEGWNNTTLDWAGPATIMPQPAVEFSCAVQLAAGLATLIDVVHPGEEKS